MSVSLVSKLLVLAVEGATMGDPSTRRQDLRKDLDLLNQQVQTTQDQQVKMEFTWFHTLPRYTKIKNFGKRHLDQKERANGRRFDQLLRFNLTCSARDDSATLSSSDACERELQDSSTTPPHDALVLYSVAPAMGHNKEYHPESNLRVPAIVNALEGFELTSKYRGSQVFELQNFTPASLDHIERVHAKTYVTGLGKAMSKAFDEGIIFIDGSGPTYATASTFQESLLAAGAGLALIDSVVLAESHTSVKLGQVLASITRSNPPIGFALIRPPGHHAIPEGPMGFCVFGNIAVAARYAQHVHALRRIFIIDFDVHHGNGTCDAFYDDPDIFFLSTHQIGSYPGTGKIEQVGKGSGEGTTLNLPLPGGSGDYAMRSVFDEVISPSVQRFKPDIILVSAGYDAHVLDPLAGLQFTASTYHFLSSSIKQLAKELCGGRCVFFLEGGYNLQSLSHSVVDTFRAFLDEPSLGSEFDDPSILYEEPFSKVKLAIQKVKQIHSL